MDHQDAMDTARRSSHHGGARPVPGRSSSNIGAAALGFSCAVAGAEPLRAGTAPRSPILAGREHYSGAHYESGIQSVVGLQLQELDEPPRASAPSLPAFFRSPQGSAPHHHQRGVSTDHRGDRKGAGRAEMENPTPVAWRTRCECAGTRRTLRLARNAAARECGRVGPGNFGQGNGGRNWQRAGLFVRGTVKSSRAARILPRPWPPADDRRIVANAWPFVSEGRRKKLAGGQPAQRVRPPVASPNESCLGGASEKFWRRPSRSLAATTRRHRPIRPPAIRQHPGPFSSMPRWGTEPRGTGSGGGVRGRGLAPG